MSRTNRTRQTGQEGIALLVCLFALLLVSGIALALLGSTDTETNINQNYRETQSAYFSAQGGIAEALYRLKATGGDAIPPPTAMPSALGGVIYIINKRAAAEVVEPWTAGSTFQDTELCKENFFPSVTNNGTGAPCVTVPTGTGWRTTYASISPFTNTTGALDFKWVRISLKSNSTSFPFYTNNSSASTTAATQVCSSGGSQALLTFGASCNAAGMEPIYVITALAVTPRGTRRMLQTEYTPVTMPPFPSALTFDGPGSALSPPYDAPNSNPFHIDGNDHGGCGGANHPAIATVNATTTTQITNAIPNNRQDHYTGSDGTTPDIHNYDPTVDTTSSNPLLQWDSPAEVETVANNLRGAALPGNVYTGNQTDINIGSQSSPQITYVNGDLNLSGTVRGGGVLIVTGTLSVSGNFGFYGVIMAIGKGIILANGGGNGQIDGTVIVAHTRDNSGNVLASMGSPVVDWSGGGGNGVYYNTCAIQSAQSGLGYRVMATREMMY